MYGCRPAITRVVTGRGTGAVHRLLATGVASGR